MNLVLLLVFFAVVFKVTLSDEVRKCCDSDEILSKEGDSFKCVLDQTKRLQLKTKNTNYKDTHVNGECQDVLNNQFVNFNVESNHIQTLDRAFFPKCCPLNYVYNTKKHSCTKKENFDNSFINETFIKVGLAHCKIIADFTLEGSDDFEYKLLSGTNQIRRNSFTDFSSFCIDRNERDAFIIRECQEGFDSCDNLKCIKKCCPDGQSFVNGARCKDSFEHGVDLSVFSHAVPNHEEDFAIIHNRTCSQIYKISPTSNISINKDGSFTEWTPLGSHTEHVGDMNSYCIEHTVSAKLNTSGYVMFHCFPEKSQGLTKFEYRLWPFIMSCVFLVLTVVVYIVIKEWRKMFGKILVNYCIASFFLFLILTVGQIFKYPTPAECQIRAFSLIFFAITQFSWATVMSFEIWCTFGTTKLCLVANHRDIKLRKFLLYNLYGWGAPLILTLTTLLFYEWRVLPYAMQPFLAEIKCFYDKKPGNYAKFIFLNIPLLIMQLVNMMLFYKTVTYCMKVRNEINKINDGHMSNSAKKFHNDRERLFLIIKLSIVMGISYIFEVVTGFFNMSQMGTAAEYTEIIFDIINASQGVFIFIIFICKKKILLTLAQKFTMFGIVYTPNSSSIRTHSSLTLNGVALTSLGNQNNHKLV